MGSRNLQLEKELNESNEIVQNKSPENVCSLKAELSEKNQLEANENASVKTSPLKHCMQINENLPDSCETLKSPIKQNGVESPIKHESTLELILDLEEEFNLNVNAWEVFRLQEQVFKELQGYLVEDCNKDLCDSLMTELSQMVRSEAGSGVHDQYSRFPRTPENVNESSESLDSEVTLSDDEFFSDEEQLLSSFSSQQKKILEDCWSEWPFPSLYMIEEICFKTGLSSQVVLRWYVERNRSELQFILSTN